MFNDVTEIITRNIPPQQWYIQDILPQQGTLLLFAEPKKMKSFMAQYSGYCIASGQPWLGIVTTQAKVAILQYEISEPAYVDRLRQMAGRFTLQPNTIWEDSPGRRKYLTDPEYLNQVRAALRALEAKVIIIDCLSACFAGDENNSVDIERFINAVELLKEENGASIILVHHSRKPSIFGGNDPMNNSRGHSKLTGWPDTIMYMGDQPVGQQLLIKSRLANHDIQPINVRFEQNVWVRR